MAKKVSMKHLGLIIVFYMINLIDLHCQNNFRNDYLSPEFHKERRQLLRKAMPQNSVAAFFSNPVRNRANDVNYVYHQDPNFYYLTGYKEPHAVLLIFKETQEIDDKATNELIYIDSQNALENLYDGPVPDVAQVMEALEINLAMNGTGFKDLNLDFSAFDRVLFYDYYDDYRDTEDPADLFDLVSQFKKKINYDQDELTIEPEPSNLDVKTLDQIMVQLRGTKTNAEIDLLRKAIDISCYGQIEVMKAIRPGMSETEVQGIHEFIFKKYRAEYEGYPSIVGAGHNGCVLHYIENYKPEIEDGELILMDLGAEYHGYTADVTRTIPVNGKFTKEQKTIYDLVYEAQEAGIEACKAGVGINDIYQATLKVVNQGLHELGIYNSLDDKDVMNPLTGRNRYYPHGCCHHIGLDVHDKGNSERLEEHMVITIEPGIYVPEGSPCDPKWWDIAVRIEDDFLVTKDGCEMLSDIAPRKSEAIEKIMAQPSAFDDLILPELKGSE